MNEKPIFNEKTLRAEIAKTWGEHGAHIEVYDMLLKRLSSLVVKGEEKTINKEQVMELVNWIVRDKFYEIPDWKPNNYGDSHGYLIWPKIIDWYYENILKVEVEPTLREEEIMEKIEKVILDNSGGTWKKGESTLMADEVDVTELIRDIYKLLRGSKG